MSLSCLFRGGDNLCRRAVAVYLAFATSLCFLRQPSQLAWVEWYLSQYPVPAADDFSWPRPGWLAWADFQVEILHFLTLYLEEVLVEAAEGAFLVPSYALVAMCVPSDLYFVESPLRWHQGHQQTRPVLKMEVV